MLRSALFLCGVASGAPIASINLPVFSWNVHWQCGSDHIKGCQTAAAKRLTSLARANNAQIVAAIELEVTSDTPIDLPPFGNVQLTTCFQSMVLHKFTSIYITAGLLGWSQVNGSCAGAPGKTGDALVRGSFTLHFTKIE